MPESAIPPPPKHGGSGGFVAAAIVMLLLMGGLIWWKVKDSDQPKPAETPVASTPPPPVLEAPVPPPPPPPVEVPDAGQAVTKRVSVGRGGGACGGECAGQATGQLKAALQGKAGASRRCYERALLQNSTLQGRMMLGVRVGADGRVCSASVTQNGIGDPGLANCVVGIFRSASLPPPQGGCVDTQVPMNFVPKTN
jgi:hypothetical protein